MTDRLGWTALVLAGDRGPEDPVAAATGVRQKAFAPVAGRPMIAHVLDALAGSPEVTRVEVALAPDAPELSADAGGRLRPLARRAVAGSPARTVLEAFDALGPPLLIVTADHPLLTPAMIGDTLAAAAGEDAPDIVAAAAARAIVEKAGSTARRTYLRFRDTEVSGCNIFACRTREARGAIALWRDIEADRKRPWRMAWRLGLGPLAAYLAGRLTTDGAATALGRAAGCRASFALLDHPDAAHDVDRPADLAFAEMRLRTRQGEE